MCERRSQHAAGERVMANQSRTFSFTGGDNEHGGLDVGAAQGGRVARRSDDTCGKF